jgi:hypothetical protein
MHNDLRSTVAALATLLACLAGASTQALSKEVVVPATAAASATRESPYAAAAARRRAAAAAELSASGAPVSPSTMRHPHRAVGHVRQPS